MFNDMFNKKDSESKIFVYSYLNIHPEIISIKDLIDLKYIQQYFLCN